MKRTLLGIVAGIVIGMTMTAGISVARGDTGDSSPLTSWVPDMDEIFNLALGNVFESAGQDITDPEIKAFYDKLTGEITESLDKSVEFDPGISLEPTPTAEGQ
jgi:hypothetical protein